MYNIEWKKRKYLQICNILDTITEKVNFCNIHTKNDKVTCNGAFKDSKSLCCSKCTYASEKGCTTISMACKIYFCYIGESPSRMGLCYNEELIKAAYRFYKVKSICLDFIEKHDIPYYKQRISMEDTFACHAGEKDIDNFLLWEAIEATPENHKLRFYY